jgi:hypothetical protein
MGKKEQPTPGPATDAVEQKISNNEDERKSYGGCHNNRDWHRSNRQQATPSTHVPKEKFVGRSDDLKGFTYDVTNNKGGVLYTRATEEIARYINEKYTTTGSFIQTAISTLTIPTQARPSIPIGTGTLAIIDAVDQEIFQGEIQMFVEAKAAIESTMKSLYALIWGQCSKLLRSRLCVHNNFATYSTTADSLALLKGIWAEMTGFCNKQYLPHSLHKIMHEFYHLTQGKHLSNQEYYNKFNSMVNPAEESGPIIGAHPSGVTAILTASAVDISFPTNAERAASVQTATQRYLAAAFILGEDNMRYGTLVEEIKKEFLQNKGSSTSAGTYPTRVAEAYNYLCNYKKGPKNLTRLLGQNAVSHSLNTGITFVQDVTKADDTLSGHEQSFATNGGSTGNANHQKKVCRRWGTDGHTSVKWDSGKEKVDAYRQSQQPNQGVGSSMPLIGTTSMIPSTTRQPNGLSSKTPPNSKVMDRSNAPNLTRMAPLHAPTRAPSFRRPTVEFPPHGTSWKTSPHVTSSPIPNS